MSVDIPFGHGLPYGDVATTGSSGGALAPANLSQAQTISQAALTQHSVITPSDLGQAQGLDNGSLSTAVDISPDDLS